MEVIIKPLLDLADQLMHAWKMVASSSIPTVPFPATPRALHASVGFRQKVVLTMTLAAAVAPSDSWSLWARLVARSMID